MHLTFPLPLCLLNSTLFLSFSLAVLVWLFPQTELFVCGWIYIQLLLLFCFLLLLFHKIITRIRLHWIELADSCVMVLFGGGVNGQNPIRHNPTEQNPNGHVPTWQNSNGQSTTGHNPTLNSVLENPTGIKSQISKDYYKTSLFLYKGKHWYQIV